MKDFKEYLQTEGNVIIKFGEYQPELVDNDIKFIKKSLKSADLELQQLINYIMQHSDGDHKSTTTKQLKAATESLKKVNKLVDTAKKLHDKYERNH